jgi:hypothetical protein
MPRSKTPPEAWSIRAEGPDTPPVRRGRSRRSLYQELAQKLLEIGPSNWCVVPTQQISRQCLQQGLGHYRPEGMRLETRLSDDGQETWVRFEPRTRRRGDRHDS